MAGYCEFSKSNNAIEAESGGLFPITKAVKIVSKATNCTRKKAREILNKIGADEYHHTSKFYNVTDYYDTAKAIELLSNTCKNCRNYDFCSVYDDFYNPSPVNADNEPCEDFEIKH